MSVAPDVKVLIAPDKFKDCLSATDVATALADGVRSTGRHLDAVLHPMADGGEGTVEAALRYGYRPVVTQVSGPLGRQTQAQYAARGATAILEASQACGLALLPHGPNPESATNASTRGVGELILHASRNGARRIVVGVGGSASTDGGAGALQALGVRLLYRAGEPVPPGGAALIDAHDVDLYPAHALLRGSTITVACDVDNPLLGADGAANVYARQKGASAADVRTLEASLSQWAALVDHMGTLRSQAGAGASGGLAFGLTALGAQLISGVDFMLELSRFDDALEGAALVIVGEGSLDSQSLRGKGPIGVARRAIEAGIPVVAAAGRSSLNRADWREAGLSGAYALTDLEPDPTRCIADAEHLLRELGARIARDWLLGESRSPVLGY